MVFELPGVGNRSPVVETGNHRLRAGKVAFPRAFTSKFPAPQSEDQNIERPEQGRAQ